MNLHHDVRFRGKLLDSLTREEAIEALWQAVAELKRLNEGVLIEPPKTQKTPPAGASGA